MAEHCWFTSAGDHGDRQKSQPTGINFPWHKQHLPFPATLHTGPPSSGVPIRAVPMAGQWSSEHPGITTGWGPWGEGGSLLAARGSTSPHSH